MPWEQAVDAGARRRMDGGMVELLRSNDLVFLSFVEATLAAAGVRCLIHDQHASAVEGGVVAIQRRVMVSESDRPRAKQALAEAEREAARRMDDGGGET